MKICLQVLKKHISKNKIFYLYKDILISLTKCSNIYFENIKFSNISISTQIINIEKSKQINFENVICENINSKESFLYGGGCFRTKNILARLIINLTILNCFSSRTAIGFKAIDEENELLKLNNFHNVSSSLNMVSIN